MLRWVRNLGSCAVLPKFFQQFGHKSIEIKHFAACQGGLQISRGQAVLQLGHQLIQLLLHIGVVGRMMLRQACQFPSADWLALLLIDPGKPHDSQQRQRIGLDGLGEGQPLMEGSLRLLRADFESLTQRVEDRTDQRQGGISGMRPWK